MTAAHCIQDKGVSQPVLPNECFFSLGKNNLKIDEKGSINSSVSRFVSHQDWNPWTESREADIAVAVLETPVEFSQFIRPLCLYNKKSDSLYGKIGTVSGWGATEKNPRKPSDIAFEINVSIIDPLKCLFEHPELIQFSSPTSLCVVNGYGRGACKG